MTLATDINKHAASECEAARPRRSRSRCGFTLIELLASMVVLVLLGTVITAGIPTALRVMEQSTFESDASLLESTIDTALADTLRYATSIHQEEGTGPWCFNTADGKHSNVYLANQVGYLFFIKTTDTTSVLVTKGIYADLEITNFKYSYDQNTQIFEGAYTIQSKKNTSLKREVSFKYKSLWKGDQ